MRITSVQKKELADIFQDLGLNVTDFETSGLHEEFKVKFKYEYYSFSINRGKSDYYYLTIYPVDNTSGYSVGANWEDVKRSFAYWASHIADELNTPSGWETFESDNYLNTGERELYEEFTTAEKELVQYSIKELQDKITTLDLSESALTAFSDKLDNLSKKVDQLNKFDWKSLFIGTIANLCFSFAIPPETNGMIWEYIKMIFKNRLN